MTGSLHQRPRELPADLFAEEPIEGPVEPLPPEAALRVTAEELSPGRGRRAVFAAADAVAGGADPVAALDAVRNDLPRELAALIDLPAGRAVPRVLTAAAAAAADRAGERRELARGVFWPLALAAATVFTAAAALAWLAPQFRQIYEEFGTPLGWPTRAALGLGEVLADGWFLAVPVGLGLVALPIWIGKSGGRRGPLAAALRPGEQARVCELLAVLVEARTPLPDALQAVAWTTPDDRLGADLADAAEAARLGTPPAAVGYGLKRVPAGLRAALRWGEDPAALAEGLRAAAETLRARGRGRLGPAGLLATAVQPILMLFVAVGVGALAVAFFYPLIDLLNDLS